MRRPLFAWFTAAVIALAGCSSPPVPPPVETQPAPPPVVRPEPAPPQHKPAGAPALERTGGGLIVKGVRERYFWYAGGRRLAVTTETGLWSIQPEGQVVELLAPAGPERVVAGPFADGLVYVEQHPGALVAFLARPGQEPRQLGAVEHPGVEQPGYPFWAAVTGSRLALAIEGRRAATIDLAKGKVAELGDEAVPVHRGALALSPTGRYLAYKQSNRSDAVRVLDLESGAVFRPGEDAHVGAIAWAPSGGRWAVLAAEPGSGLPAGVGANTVDGGTHIDVGDVKGAIRHLMPPTRLELVDGPWWSGDGQYLAVVAGTAVDPHAPRRLWSVDVDSGEWQQLGTLPSGGFVTGFGPDGHSLEVYSQGRLELWPAGGAEPIEVTTPWPPGSGMATVLPGGALLMVAAEPKQQQLLLVKPQSDPVVLAAPPLPKGRLTVQGGYAALVLYTGGLWGELLILPLPK